LLQVSVARACEDEWLQSCVLQELYYRMDQPRQYNMPLLPSWLQVFTTPELDAHDHRDDATRTHGSEDELHQRLWCGVDCGDVRRSPYTSLPTATAEVQRDLPPAAARQQPAQSHSQSVVQVGSPLSLRWSSRVKTEVAEETCRKKAVFTATNLN